MDCLWWPTLYGGPERFSAGLRRQVAAFRDEALLPALRDRIVFVDHESHAALLREKGGKDARAISDLLLKRIGREQIETT